MVTGMCGRSDVPWRRGGLAAALAALNTGGASLVVEAVDSAAALEWARAERIPFVQGSAALPKL